MKETEDGKVAQAYAPLADIHLLTTDLLSALAWLKNGSRQIDLSFCGIKTIVNMTGAR